MQSGVPQGSVWKPVLHQIFTSDLSSISNTFTATFVYNTRVMVASEVPKYASDILEKALDKIQA